MEEKIHFIDFMNLLTTEKRITVVQKEINKK